MSPSSALIAYQPSNKTPGPFLRISEGLERVTVCKLINLCSQKSRVINSVTLSIYIYMYVYVYIRPKAKISKHINTTVTKSDPCTLAPLAFHSRIVVFQSLKLFFHIFAKLMAHCIKLHKGCERGEDIFPGAR